MRRVSLLLLAAATGSVASPTLQARQAPPPSPNDDLLGYPPVYNGYYTFVSCDATQGQALNETFTKMTDIIKTQIMPSLQTPPPDPAQDPFPVFFAEAPRDWINDTFTGILGRTLYRADQDSWRPRIICFNDGVPELAKARAVCDQGIQPVSFSQSSGVNTVIYLCPAFFDDLPAFPTKGENCPTVNASVDPSKYV